MRGTHWSVAKPPAGTLLDRSHPLARGLVALWPLYAGNGNKAASIASPSSYLTSSAAATWNGTLGSQWQITPRGMAANFDGTTNYIDVGSKILFQTTDSFTLACWFRWKQALGSSLSFSLIDSGFGFAAGAYALLLGTTATVYTATAAIRDASSHIVSAGKSSATLGIADNAWHLLVGVCDRSTPSAVVRCYLDGVLLASSGADTTTGQVGNTANVVLGARGSDHAQKFVGQLDMPAVWSRALTAGEILQIYSAPYALFAPYGFLTSFPQPARPVRQPSVVIGL
jgi:hypothetical protein